ncbi:MAG: AMP-binding protein [Blastocatellia bacterium]
MLQMDGNDPTPHLERFESYEQACLELHLVIPKRFNIASVICRKHDDAVSRVALSELKEGGINTYTFGGLDFLSDKFAMALAESGIAPGDSVALIVPQSAAAAVAQLGALKRGAVVVPLSMSSEVALLEQALTDSGARAIIVDESIHTVVEPLARSLPELKQRFVVRDLRPVETSSSYKDFWTEVDRASSDFEAVEAEAGSPAFLFYVESEDKCIGVVHSQRSVMGQLASFEMLNNLEHEAGSVCWAADDYWSSPGAVLGVIYPAWWYGYSIATAIPRDTISFLRLMELCGASLAFIPSAQTRKHSASEGLHPESLNLKLRTVLTDSSPGVEYLVNNQPGITINEVYGKPEAGWIAGGCRRWFAKRDRSLGHVVPGRLIEIMDDNGTPLGAHKVGHIAVHKSDPGLFSGYHNEPGKTADSFIGDWFMTSDFAYRDENGDLYLAPKP